MKRHFYPHLSSPAGFFYLFFYFAPTQKCLDQCDVIMDVAHTSFLALVFL